jgi:two-component system NtrC family sensor kinase
MDELNERQPAEEALRESENLLRTIVDNEPECLKVLAPDGTILMMNRSGLAMLEADTPAEIVGRRASTLVAPEHRAAFESLSGRVLAGEGGQLEFTIVGLRGTRRWVESHAVPLRDRRGDITGILSITRDVTARKRAEDARSALLDVGRALSRSLDLDVVVSVVADSILTLLAVDAAAVYRPAPDSGELVLLGAARAVPDFYWAPRLAEGHGMAGRAVVERRMVTSADVLHDPHVVLDAATRAAVERRPHGTLLALPLVVLDRIAAVLVVSGQPGRVFTADEVALAEAFAVQAAMALENARLYSEARAAAARLADVVASSPAVIYRARVHGTEFVLEWVSENAPDVLGVTTADLLEGWWGGRLHPDDRTAVETARRILFERDHAVAEYRLRRGDDGDGWVRDELRLRRDATGTPLEAVGSIVDITEHRRTEDMLRQSEKVAAMGSLLAGVAHELNNPLAVVLGHTQILQSRVQGSEAERVHRMAQAAERCGRIVRNFLALARQQPPEWSSVVLADVVRDAVELLAYPLRLDGIDVVQDADAGLPTLWADAHQLHQLLVNLVTNAHQAMRQHPHPRRLTIAARADVLPPRVRLEVADTGPGIPPALRSRVFEPFFTTRPPGQGTGLGLSLSHGIVATHGGSIEIDDAPGGGCLIRIELPVHAGPGGGDAPSPAALSAPTRVLVVDDELEVGHVLADMLAVDGHRADVVGNATLALEQVETVGYDVLLCDLRMPGVDGSAVYRQLVERDHPLTQRFAFLTGDALSPDTVAFLRDCGLPWLEKPFRFADVRRVVSELLAR